VGYHVAMVRGVTKVGTTERSVAMLLLRVGMPIMGLMALIGIPVQAADLETRIVDKNCWVEIFDDDDFDMGDAHVKLQGPKEYATLKDVSGKDWTNDIESIIVGSNARVRTYSNKDFKGTELALAPGQRVPNLGKLDMKDDIESMKISCGS
jgi:hypothetical protein